MSQGTDIELGQLIKETGDFGRFQVAIILMFALALLTLNWSMLTMVFTGAIPDYACIVFTQGNGSVSEMNTCDVNGTSCDVTVFDGSMRTAVSEVCK